MDIKIRGATKEQWPIVADMVRGSLGIIDKVGERRGLVMVRGDLVVYLYITRSGKTAVALTQPKDL